MFFYQLLINLTFTIILSTFFHSILRCVVVFLDLSRQVHDIATEIMSLLLPSKLFPVHASLIIIPVDTV
jgi:hypothetical protein